MASAGRMNLSISKGVARAGARLDLTSRPLGQQHSATGGGPYRGVVFDLAAEAVAQHDRVGFSAAEPVRISCLPAAAGSMPPKIRTWNRSPR